MKHYCWIWQVDNMLQVQPTTKPDASSPFIRLKFPDSTIYIVNQSHFEPFNAPSKRYNVPYLKSNLQKAIRQKNVNVALATTSQLLKQDPNELLRRLPIIATEDSYWTKWINHVVWIMCWYSKTKTLSVLHYNVVLNAVRQLCEMDVAFDYRGMNDEPTPMLHPDMIFTDSFQLAITIRQNYGGMSGDMHLLAYTKEKKAWDDDSGNNCNTPEDAGEIPTFSKQHMLPEAIDFHCSDIMNKISSNIPSGVLRKWIWEFRSGRNVRKPWTQTVPPHQWSEICQELDRLSLEYWDKAEVLHVPPQSPPTKRQCLITDFIQKK